MTEIKIAQRSLLNSALGLQKDVIPLGKDDIDEIFVKSQGRQLMMTEDKQAKIRQLLRANPDGGVSLTIDKLTGQILHIQGAK